MTKKERIEILKKIRERDDKLFNNNFIRTRKEDDEITVLDELICNKLVKIYGKRKKIHCIYKSDLDKAPNIIYLIEWEKDILHSMICPISKKEINEYFKENPEYYKKMLFTQMMFPYKTREYFRNLVVKVRENKNKKERV